MPTCAFFARDGLLWFCSFRRSRRCFIYSIKSAGRNTLREHRSGATVTGYHSAVTGYVPALTGYH